MKAIQIISQDLFDKIRSRFVNLEMGDERGAVTIDPAHARFFDFDVVFENNTFGRVSISLNETGCLKIYYSKGITENHNSTLKKNWYDFLREMRQFSMRRLLRFDTRDISKTNLDTNDFQHLANKQKTGTSKQMTAVKESKWGDNSTRRTSKAVTGKTQVIVRHIKPIDETSPAGARSQNKNIRAIFIQNRDGERFKYPFIHTEGAFAMAQHVDHGGVPHDDHGRAIIAMSEEIAQLQEFQKRVQRTTLHSDASGITERALKRLARLRSKISTIGRGRFYEEWINEMNGVQQPSPNTDIDAVALEDYKSKFSQVTYRDELSEFFPLLHRIMQEDDVLELEDLVPDEEPDEVDSEPQTNKPSEFSQWADNTVDGLPSKEGMAKLLKDLTDTQEVELGPDGEIAWQFFKNYGFTNSSLEAALQTAAATDPSANGVTVALQWAKDASPAVYDALSRVLTPNNATPDSETPDSTAPTEIKESAVNRDEVIQEVAKIVRSFYNRDNPEVGPFRGGENIALDINKEITEKWGQSAGRVAEQLARTFMEKLTRDWEANHSATITESTSVESSIKGIVALADSIGQTYKSMTSLAEKWYHDRGEFGPGFNMILGGRGYQWVESHYIDRMKRDLHDLAAQTPKHSAALKQFLEQTVGYDTKLSFSIISSELPSILNTLGNSIGSRQLVMFAQYWIGQRDTYRKVFDKLRSSGEEPSAPAAKQPKQPSVVGAQNAQVDSVVNNILATLPSKISGDVRNAIARSPNKLLALQSELSKRGIKLQESIQRILNRVR